MVFDLAKIVVTLAIVVGVGWLVYYGIFVYEPEKTVWTHLTLSSAEQERAKAECEMQAFEAIGGSDLGSAPGARYRYTKSCLIAKGFVLKADDDR